MAITTIAVRVVPRGTFSWFARGANQIIHARFVVPKAITIRSTQRCTEKKFAILVTTCLYPADPQNQWSQTVLKGPRYVLSLDFLPMGNDNGHNQQSNRSHTKDAGRGHVSRADPTHDARSRLKRRMPGGREERRSKGRWQVNEALSQAGLILLIQTGRLSADDTSCRGRQNYESEHKMAKNRKGYF